MGHLMCSLWVAMCGLCVVRRSMTRPSRRPARDASPDVSGTVPTHARNMSCWKRHNMFGSRVLSVLLVGYKRWGRERTNPPPPPLAPPLPLLPPTPFECPCFLFFPALSMPICNTYTVEVGSTTTRQQNSCAVPTPVPDQTGQTTCLINHLIIAELCQLLSFCNY